MCGFLEADQKVLAHQSDSLSTGSGDFLEMTVITPCLEGRFFQVAKCIFLNTYLGNLMGQERRKLRGSLLEVSWAVLWGILARLLHTLRRSLCHFQT